MNNRLATATAAVFVALSVTVVVSPTAAAEPRQTPGAKAFSDCVFAGWSKNVSMSYAAKQQVAEDCCLNLGGIFNESTHTCYLPANNMTVAEPAEPPVAPGPTAVLPRGADTRSIQ